MILNSKFSDAYYVLQDKQSSKMIGRGNCCNGLYWLSHGVLCFNYIAIVCPNVWHSRLGHLSSKCLSLLKEKLSLPALSNSPCHICSLAKERRLSFPFNNHVASNPFDLVHCDTWGPFKEPTYAGFRYFLTFADDCSHLTWMYLMQHKSDALHIVPRFFRMVETQYSKKIKVFRSVNAPELKFVDFFAANGTLH